MSPLASFMSFGRSENIIREGPSVDGLLDKAKSHVLHQPSERQHDIDFVFIHDSVPDPDRVWKSHNSDKPWPTHLFEHFPTSARVIIYEYKRNWVKSLAEIVNPEHLHTLSEELLVALGQDEYKSDVPLVVFAHGFGGLLYEQAVVLSEDRGNIFKQRKHTAFLFGTPHMGAGIAEWAIMTAKSHGISCAKTAQAQDWSLLKHKIDKTATMQKQFREILKKPSSRPRLSGCFSTKREPASSLILAPEWAVLPEFKPIAVDHGHSSMTMLVPEDNASRDIVKTLESVVKQLVGGYAEPLADTLFRSMTTSAFNKTDRKFLSQAILVRSLTADAVRQELGTTPNPTVTVDTSTVDFIVQHAKILFATMVCCRIDASTILDSMKTAAAEGFKDDQLPLNSPIPHTGTPIPFQQWRRGRLNRFYEMQWNFLAPVFSMEIFSIREFDGNIILPFVSVETQTKPDAIHRTQRFGISPRYLGKVESDGVSTTEYVVVERIDSRDQWQIRAGSIESLRNSIPEHMIKPIAAFTIQDRYYIMYEASLHDNWELRPWKSPTVQTVKELSHQLSSLVQSLESKGFRHLSFGLYAEEKPENLLKYPKDLRPEDSGANLDVWPIGCVILEAIIYTLYGYDEVQKLRHSARNSSLYSLEEQLHFAETIRGASKAKILDSHLSYFYLSTTKRGKKVQASALFNWINAIRRKPWLSEVSRDVMDLVENTLRGTRDQTLVDEIGSPLRLRLLDSIEEIELYDKYDPRRYPEGITPNDWRLPGTSLLDYQFIVDNDFAKQAMERLRKEYPLPSPTEARLCEECMNVDFTGYEFKMARQKLEIQENLQRCQLCTMLFDACRVMPGWVRLKECIFERMGSNIYLSNFPFSPVLSLLRNLGTFTTYLLRDNTRDSDEFVLDLKSPHPIQIGFPQLPKKGEDTFELIKAWLENCDVNHSDCQLRRIVPMPKRLIDVNEEVLTFCEFFPSDTKKYIALSRVQKADPAESDRPPPYEDGLLVKELPEMLKDAVKTTKGLGIRYLWVDILCTTINEKDKSPDIATELDDAFSGAYCVLVPCYQGRKSSGFLNNRPERPLITISDKNSTGQLYLCTSIDDFHLNIVDYDDPVMEKGLQRLMQQEFPKLMQQEFPGLTDEKFMDIMDRKFMELRRDPELIASIRQHGYHDNYIAPEGGYDRDEIECWIIQQMISVRDTGNSLRPKRLRLEEWIPADDADNYPRLRRRPLEERISACRSVYFGKDQLYLECGNGIRCETLSLLYSQAESFLADPHFPSKALKAPLVDKISLFRSFYLYYSQVSDVEAIDRWLAFTQIEKRLEAVFQCPSRYGIFEGSLMPYSLLWYRAYNFVKALDPSTVNIPTWSWLLYKGVIDYITPASGTVAWDTSIQIIQKEIHADIWQFRWDELSHSTLAKHFTIYDREDDITITWCVKLGEEIQPTGKIYYAMIVRQVEGEDTYRRVGAGILSSSHIHENLPPRRARII
ncbi:hypothetical protein ANO14919_070200 [Xylariales sp. No.14919]|nr:hypothetical protein ANO14919_070200 [Xylariales sp. No.14919]